MQPVQNVTNCSSFISNKNATLAFESSLEKIMLPIIVVVRVNLTCVVPSTGTSAASASEISSQVGLSANQLYARYTIYYETVTLYDQIVTKISNVVNNGNFTTTLRQFAKLYTTAGLSAVVISSIPVVLSTKPVPPSKSPTVPIEVSSTSSSANITSFNTTLLVIIVGAIVLALLLAIAIYYVYLLSLRDRATKNLKTLQDNIVISSSKPKESNRNPQRNLFDFESYLNKLIGAKTDEEQAEIMSAQRKKREQKRGSLKALQGQQVSYLLQKVNKIIGMGHSGGDGEQVVDNQTVVEEGRPTLAIPIIGMATTDSIWSYESAFPDTNRQVNPGLIATFGAVDPKTRKSLSRFSDAMAAEKRSSAAASVLENVGDGNGNALMSYENAYAQNNSEEESVVVFSLDNNARKSLQRYSASSSSSLGPSANPNPDPIHSNVYSVADQALQALLQLDSDFQTTTAAAFADNDDDVPEEFDEMAVKQRINEVLDLFGDDDDNDS